MRVLMHVSYMAHEFRYSNKWPKTLAAVRLYMYIHNRLQTLMMQIMITSISIKIAQHTTIFLTSIKASIMGWYNSSVLLLY